jgi:hypothetical protein
MSTISQRKIGEWRKTKLSLLGMDVLSSQYTDVYDHYEQTLQEAYDALTEIEDALNTLGMKLEYQHFRLGGAVDELKPLMIQPHSPSD